MQPAWRLSDAHNLKKREMTLPKTLPTLIHVTHWKSGSQWIHEILRACFLDQIVPPTIENGQFLNEPIIAGGVYPTVYITKDEFSQAALPKKWHRFVVIRDLRDTLVSGYFSIKNSHPPVGPIPQWRQELSSMSQEEGLLWVFENWLPASATIQASWVKANEPFIKYEDLLVNDVDILTKIIIDDAHYPISKVKLEQIITAHRFESMSGGRQRGEEDLNAHERKGIAGDWRNYFSPKLNKLFMEHYGNLLVKLQYERNEM